MINEFDLADLFISHGFKDKDETLGIMNSWDAVLATSENIPGKKHFCLPSKSFDNVVTGKRVFAFITDGAQVKFYKNFPQVSFFNPTEVDKNLPLLNEEIQKANDKFEMRFDIPIEYTRRFQARQLFDLVND